MDYEKSKKAIAAAKTPEELKRALEKAYVDLKAEIPSTVPLQAPESG